MRVRILVALLGCLIALAGCAEPTVQGGKPNPKPVKKLVSLSPSVTEIVAMNMPQMLAGRTAACNFPPTGLEQVPVLATVKPDYEKLAKVAPDLVVYDANLFSDADVTQMKAAAPKANFLPFAAQTVQGYIDWLLELGKLTGTETAMSEYSDKVYGALERARGAAPTPLVRTLVLSGDGPGALFAAGKKSLLADVIRQGGGELLGDDSNRFTALKPEAIVSGDPELILVAGEASTVLKDPRFAATSAVKRNQVYGLNADVLLRAGSRFDKLIEGISRILPAARAAK